MMIHNVEFQPVKNRFLWKLKENVKTIKNINELPIDNNKLSNIYKIQLPILLLKHIINQIETSQQNEHSNKEYGY